jgi:hypothetical protein
MFLFATLGCFWYDCRPVFAGPQSGYSTGIRSEMYVRLVSLRSRKVLKWDSTRLLWMILARLRNTERQPESVQSIQTWYN